MFFKNKLYLFELRNEFTIAYIIYSFIDYNIHLFVVSMISYFYPKHKIHVFGWNLLFSGHYSANDDIR
jgi:hypothetical protein